MYYQYFGLEEAPFSIAVNPRYLYMSPRHRDALAHLLYGVGAGGGFILLTGEVGTGKTTINRCLLEQLPDHADVAVVLNPALDARDLLATVCDELAISFELPSPGLKELTDALHRFLLENHEAGRKTVLMIDEAQHLGFDVLEQIRLLTNLETNEEKLLHIILIGQPELAAKLARPELRQLNQRITARFDLRALTVPETGAYIRHRLHVAGLPAGRDLFGNSLIRAIHSRSGGIPRIINLLCDRMLLGAYGQGLTTLNRSLLRQAAAEVTGSDPATSIWQSRWFTAASVAIIALLAGLLAWSQLQSGAPVLQSAGEQQPKSQPAQVAAEESPVQQMPSEMPPVAIADDQPSLPSVAMDEAVTVNWRLSPEEGVELLGRLYGSPIAEPSRQICNQTWAPELRCEVASGGTWNELTREPRPALLRLVDERRFETQALFLGVDGDQAIVATTAGLVVVPITDLARQWTGEYWRLWRAPEELARTLQRGDRGDDVRYLASLFAEFDGQDEPLSDDRFDARLEQRLMYFQDQHGLDADGVLGEQTLRALSLAAGIDLNNRDARVAVESSSSGGATLAFEES